MEEGPLAGCLIGFAEQAQLRDAVFYPDGKWVGRCSALWGFEFVRDDLDVLTTLSLSINGSFRLGRLRHEPELQAGERFRTAHAEAHAGGMKVSVAR
ncbi:hypothetical protein [Cupriavidus necator]